MVLKAARKRPRFAEVQVGPVWPTAAPGLLEVHLPGGTTVRGSNATELAALARALRSPFDKLRAPSPSRG